MELHKQNTCRHLNMAAREFISNEFGLRTYEEAFVELGRSREFASYLSTILTMCGEQNWPTWGVAWARQNLMEIWLAVEYAYQTDYVKRPVPLPQPFPHTWMALEYGGSPHLWKCLLEPLDLELEDFYLWTPRIQLNIRRMVMHTGILLNNLRKGKYGETPPSNIQRSGKCYANKVKLSLFHYGTLQQLYKIFHILTLTLQLRLVLRCRLMTLSYKLL